MASAYDHYINDESLSVRRRLRYAEKSLARTEAEVKHSDESLRELTAALPRAQQRLASLRDDAHRELAGLRAELGAEQGRTEALLRERRELEHEASLCKRAFAALLRQRSRAKAQAAEAERRMHRKMAKTRCQNAVLKRSVLEARGGQEAGLGLDACLACNALVADDEQPEVETELLLMEITSLREKLFQIQGHE